MGQWADSWRAAHNFVSGLDALVQCREMLKLGADAETDLANIQAARDAAVIEHDKLQARNDAANVELTQSTLKFRADLLVAQQDHQAALVAMQHERELRRATIETEVATLADRATVEKRTIADDLAAVEVQAAVRKRTLQREIEEGEARLASIKADASAILGSR